MQRLGLRRMFTKLEQRSWLKLKQAGAKQQKSYRGLEEAWGSAALPYRTVARWVQAFRCRPLRPDHQQNRGCQRYHATLSSLGTVLHTFGEYIEGLWKYELCRCAVSKVTAALPKLKFQPSYITYPSPRILLTTLVYYGYFNPTFWGSLVVFVPVTANLIINYFRVYCSVARFKNRNSNEVWLMKSGN